MKKNCIYIIMIFLASLMSVQCDIILGSGGNVNVSIDLGDLWGDGSGRAVQLVPDYTVCTNIRVTVFGDNMQPMEKTVSPGTRYINLYVPAGNNRHFTLESFFKITDIGMFPYEHMRSFKGRASVDLKPGTAIKLQFRMVAGATTLLVVDYMQGRIWEGENITFSSPIFGIAPFISDIDIASDGRIVGTINDTFNPTSSIQIGQDVSGFITYFNNPSAAFALAMDRDIRININQDVQNIIDTNLLYLAIGGNLYYSILADSTLVPIPPSAPTLMNPSGLDTIEGMAVDPWTHHLFLVGTVGIAVHIPTVVEYDPTFIDPLKPGGRVLRSINQTAIPSFRILQDVIVKDDGIFILNEVDFAETNIPVVLKFDRNLKYQSGFGGISSDGIDFLPSTQPGMFYHPKRFFAHENDGLYIIDDSELYDKIVFINTALDPSSWKTFPPDQSGGEPFVFIENNF